MWLFINIKKYSSFLVKQILGQVNSVPIQIDIMLRCKSWLLNIYVEMSHIGWDMTLKYVCKRQVGFIYMPVL
jgi:hypothetical protein